jgi:hypothetical protein
VPQININLNPTCGTILAYFLITPYRNTVSPKPVEFYQCKPYLYVWYWIMSIYMLGWWYILVVIDRQHYDSRGFESFLQDKCSSLNDTLNPSKCMCIPPQRLFDFAFLSSYHLHRLLWSLVRIKVAYLHHVMLLSQKPDHRRD